jgi:flagellar hook-basal body complex protein FliE
MKLKMELAQEENSDLLEMLEDFEQSISLLCQKLDISGKQALLLSKLVCKSKGNFISSQVLANFFGKKHLDFLEEYLGDLYLLEEKRLLESKFEHNTGEHCFRAELDVIEYLSKGGQIPKKQKTHFGERLKKFITDINHVQSYKDKLLAFGAEKIASNFMFEVHNKLLDVCENFEAPPQKEYSGEMLELLNAFTADANRIWNYANQLVRKLRLGSIENIHEVMFAIGEAKFASNLTYGVRCNLLETSEGLKKRE